MAIALERVARGRELCRNEPACEWNFRVLKSEVLIWQGKSKESLSILDEELPPSLSRTEIAVRRRRLQGTANYYLQEFEESKRQLAEAEQLAVSNHPPLLGEVLLSQGSLALLLNDYPSAKTRFRRAVEIARKEKDRFSEINALGSMGVLYMRTQHYGEAIDAYEASLELSRQLGNRVQIGKTLGNLGWCYYKLGDFERSRDLFTESEALAAQLGADRDRHLWLSNIGLLYFEQRDYDKATEYFQKALALARKLQNKTASAACLNNLALTAVAAGEFDRAELYNREALDLKRANHDRASELYSLLNLALISAGRHDFSAAEKTLQQVIRDAADDVSLRWEAEADLANVYLAEGKLAKADQQFRNAIKTVDSARASLNKEENRLSFLTSASRFYNDYIDFLVSHDRTKEALDVAEHSRARTLAEGLSLDRHAGLNIAPLHPEQVAKRANAVILSYWLKPGQSYLWTISGSQFSLFRLASDTEINAEVEAYRKALAGPRDVRDSANSHGRKLYDMLVAPAEKLFVPGSRVIVIPDGSLHGLNFETLLAPGPRVHYWIEDVVIANASSIALLAGSSAGHASVQSNPGAQSNLLLIGDPVSPSPEYPELSAAALELAAVQDHFPADRRLVIAREKAVPRAYSESNPGRFAYIHFVTHGTSSRISPLDSGVILSRDGDAYKLYARDIMQQPLRADLVTVSACYGAGTRAYSGEGLVGLAWAFLRAGAHHVIAASWEVNDVSTAQLMDALYTELAKVKDPATALRSAKLKMLHSQTVYRRPFYWAAFQVYTGS